MGSLNLFLRLYVVSWSSSLSDIIIMSMNHYQTLGCLLRQEGKAHESHTYSGRTDNCSGLMPGIRCWSWFHRTLGLARFGLLETLGRIWSSIFKSVCIQAIHAHLHIQQAFFFLAQRASLGVWEVLEHFDTVGYTHSIYSSAESSIHTHVCNPHTIVNNHLYVQGHKFLFPMSNVWSP
jgi:hypothetical protein